MWLAGLAACGLAGVSEGDEVGGNSNASSSGMSLPPGTTSSSSGDAPGNDASSSSSSGDRADASPDAPVSTCARELTPPRCSDADVVCQGSAQHSNDYVHLTQESDNQAGAFWLRVDPSAMRTFSLEFDVQIPANQNVNASVGNGLAFAFVEALANEQFPQIGAATNKPTLAIGNLAAGRGAAGFLRTYDGGDAKLGRFLTGETTIPSPETDNVVEQWITASGSGSFTSTQGARLRVRIHRSAGQQALMTVLRAENLDDPESYTELTNTARQLTLPREIGFVGVTANTGHPQATNSRHSLRSIRIGCTH